MSSVTTPNETVPVYATSPKIEKKKSKKEYAERGRTTNQNDAPAKKTGTRTKQTLSSKKRGMLDPGKRKKGLTFKVYSNDTLTLTQQRKSMEDTDATEAIRESIIIAAIHACRNKSHNKPFKAEDGKTYGCISKAFSTHSGFKPCKICKSVKQSAYYCRLRKGHVGRDFDGETFDIGILLNFREKVEESNRKKDDSENVEENYDTNEGEEYKLEKKKERFSGMNKNEEKWQRMYQELTEYRNENGHCLVPNKGLLGNWVKRQRDYFRKNFLTPTRKELLDRLDFEFDAQLRYGQEQKWRVQYQQLVEFYKKHGHCYTPSKYNSEFTKLSRWIQAQRRSFKKGTLSDERRRLLDGINFDYEPPEGFVYDLKWNENFHSLLHYKAQHGDTLVPLGYEDRTLAHWIYRIRKEDKSEREGKKCGSLLNEERRKQLNEIGFVWELTIDQQKPQWKNAWMARLNQLKRFKELYGHCNVPSRYKDIRGLVNWTKKMKLDYIDFQDGKDTLMTQERIDLLTELGFDFGRNVNRTRRSWDDRFEQLKEFYDKHGHVNVPAKYTKVLLLPKWIKQQRDEMKKLFDPNETSKMTWERFKKLERVGFHFTVDPEDYVVWEGPHQKYSEVFKKTKSQSVEEKIDYENGEQEECEEEIDGNEYHGHHGQDEDYEHNGHHRDETSDHILE